MNQNQAAAHPLTDDDQGPLFPSPLLIAWTTVSSRNDAEHLATPAVSAGLAACAQIEGPIASLYLWQGKLEKTEEFRITFKALPEQIDALEAFILGHHPYDTPEWVVIRAERVPEKYLSWARANPKP